MSDARDAGGGWLRGGGVVVVSGGGTLVTSALATEAGETAELDLAHHHSNADSRWNWCSGTKTECLINFNGCAQG